MSTSRQFVVLRHHPGRDILWLTLMLGGLAAVLYLVWTYGWESGGVALERERALNESLVGRVVRLSDENARLRARLTVLERSGQIERTAHDEVEGSLASLQEEVVTLRKELSFYRGIVASADSARGLTVQSFDARGDGGGVFRYRLVLTQFRKSGNVVSGTVEMSLDGERQGTPARLAFAEMGDERGRRIKFKFKNFQQIEGRGVVPPDFTPRRVLVQVKAPGDKRKNIEETFDWLWPEG